jgi:RNase H-fold protein (predicted Holliday junction resolvase)
MKIVKIDEDYTSVQASAETWDFDKKAWKEDTIAAMKILERIDKS